MIIAVLILNSVALLLVVYYVDRTWTKLIEQANHLNSIDNHTWRNTEKLNDIYRKIDR